MAGTIPGGKSAAETNIARYGESFYKQIGSAGGKWKGKKGFSNDRDLARAAGYLGGSVSRRFKSGRKLTPEEKAKVRRKAQKRATYRRLLAIHEKAKKQRQPDTGKGEA